MQSDYLSELLNQAVEDGNVVEFAALAKKALKRIKTENIQGKSDQSFFDDLKELGRMRREQRDSERRALLAHELSTRRRPEPKVSPDEGEQEAEQLTS